MSRMLEITDRMLCMTRSTEDEPGLRCEDLDLRECGSYAVSLMSAQAMARGVKLVLEWPPRPVVVKCDRQLVERVLVNLVGNAIKVSPVGERVTTIMEDGKTEARVQVLDGGPGIPARARAAVFDLSEQGSPTANAFALLRRSMEACDFGSSRGLGLALSKVSVESLGGRIGLVGREGGGSAFWFTLPLAT
jgi:signal transduction histidine kinase